MGDQPNLAKIDESVDAAFIEMIESPHFDRLTPFERDLFLLQINRRCAQYIADRMNF